MLNLSGTLGVLRNVVEAVILDRDTVADEFNIDKLCELFLHDLGSEQVESRIRRDRLRLRLALHLSPTEAIAYDVSNPRTRTDLIREHLAHSFMRPDGELITLARQIARSLEAWETERDNRYRSYKPRLLTRDGPYCRCCHVEFEALTAESLQSNDPFKPYRAVDRSNPMNSATVDHISPVSGFGDNALSNLQLLCKLCNQGKGSLEPPLAKHEFENAAKRVEDASWIYRAQLLYFTLASSNFACSICGTTEAELTARKRLERGALVLSNTRSTCYACLLESRTDAPA